MKRYPFEPTGEVITLDDLTDFVAEMRGHRNLPGDTPVRFTAAIEIDFQSGPRATRITACPEQ